MQAGEEGGAAGCADGGSAVGLHVTRPFCGKPVEIWCLDDLLTVTAEVTLGDVIREDEDEVGFLGGDERHRDRCEDQSKERFHSESYYTR